MTPSRCHGQWWAPGILAPVSPFFFLAICRPVKCSSGVSTYGRYGARHLCFLPAHPVILLRGREKSPCEARRCLPQQGDAPAQQGRSSPTVQMGELGGDSTGCEVRGLHEPGSAFSPLGNCGCVAVCPSPFICKQCISSSSLWDGRLVSCGTWQVLEMTAGPEFLKDGQWEEEDLFHSL